MASVVPHASEKWPSRRVVTFAGALDTRKDSGDDYATITLAQLFGMDPASAEKARGPAMIPSSYASADARSHEAQRTHGIFVCLCADIDGGNHPIDRIAAAIDEFAPGVARLIYSSPHAMAGDMRWRVIIPLAKPQLYDVWHDAQSALFNFLAYSGIDPDRALARAGQPVYLPNVPATHAKTGAPLRDDDGTPIYYERQTTGTTSPGLDIGQGNIAAGIDAIRRKREDDDRERDRIRRDAERRREARPTSDAAPIISDFNAANNIANLLELYGYQQSSRNPDDWRSPHQTGESYATRVIGDKWVSLSQSDAGARLGDTFPSGCYGDAYDLFVHYEHAGDHKSAFRTLYQERRASQSQSIAQANDAMFDPDTGEVIDGPEAWGAPWVADQAAPLAEESGDILDVFHPAEWQDKPPPARSWRWDGFVPNFQATLLTGAGAAGKSLAMQQMSTCIAMGLPFLGIETRRCPTLYITCEDDIDELHRRQTAICAMLNIPLAATRDALHILSLQGRIGNELATFDNDGRMKIGERYRQIVATCKALGVQHCTIDNTAHTYAGNENDRHQVAAFVNLNNALAHAIEGSVIMVGHPNKAGDSYSGSTAWENQVRSRIYLEIPKSPDDGAPIHPDMRTIRNEKANYSRRGAEVSFFWKDGAFVEKQGWDDTVDIDSGLHAHEEDTFLMLLDKLTAQRRHVSHSQNLANYAPKVMYAMPEAKGISQRSFRAAMERLFAAGEIIASQPLWLGSDRHPVRGIAKKTGEN